MALVDRFCQRWTDAQISIHDTVAEGDRVVFLWSFQARPVGAPDTDPPSGWGGITLFRFDEAGKIVAEVGEESTRARQTAGETSRVASARGRRFQRTSS